MDLLFGTTLAALAVDIPTFVPPTDSQIQAWLHNTAGRVDKELCTYLGFSTQCEYVYTGTLNVHQRAYIYHILNE